MKRVSGLGRISYRMMNQQMSGVTEDDLSSTVTASQNPDCKREESITQPPWMSDLKIILLGKSVPENSEVGNFILGRAAFDSEAPPDVVERVKGRLKDRTVTIINSPQLLQTNISDHQITQTVRECVSLSDPGPHVIVLLLKHDQCSTEDHKCVEKVLDSFSEHIYQHTMVLTTQEPTETNDILQKIIQKCFNRHFSLQRNSSPDDLLKVFEDIVKMNDGRHLVCTGALQYFTMKQQGMKKFSAGVKLNLVVCGSDGTLKSSVSELILHQTDRRSDVELHGPQISLVDLPALFNTRLSEEEVLRQTLRCLSVCDPGVHFFLLIIPDASLTNEDKAEIEAITKIFGSRVNKHMMILIKQNSEHQTEELNEETQSVIDRFGGRHQFLGPKTQVSTLMKNIEKMLEENRGEFFSTRTFLEAQIKKLMTYEEMKKKINSQETNLLSPESEDDLRIVLLGKTGVGKSATGNTILGNEAFTAETSHKSVTKESQRESSEINGRHLTVIDTPGLFDTELSNEEIQREISNCISMILPGPHVFIIVINLGRFTKEEATSVKIIQETFGERSLKYTMVLFTRGDDLKNKTIEQFLGEPGSPLMNLIEVCGNRFHVFNNNQTGDRTQVSDLLEKIDTMVEVNGGSFYSCKMFRKMERELQEKQMKILMDRVKEKEEEMKKLEEEKEIMKMIMEEERQTHDKEIKRREDEFKREMREQEKHQKEIRDEMRRERETFKHEIEEMRQEKENMKKEREKLQLKYDTDIDRLMNRIDNERQNHETERKIREKEYLERKEQYKTQIKEKEEKERERCEEMKREREEWEKQKLEEKTRREEEDEKRRDKEQKICDDFNQRLKKEKETMEREKEDLQSKHEAEENKMKIMMEKLNREREELMKKLEEEKTKMTMMMEEERKNHDKERKRREEEFREREERQKREIKNKDEQEREMRENTKRDREMFKNEMDIIRQEKENVKKEKENLKTEYIIEMERLMKIIQGERQNHDTERRRREEEFNERQEQYKTQKIKHKEEREEQMQRIKREQEEWEKQKLEEKIRKEEDEKRRESEKQKSNEHILKLKSEMEGIIREKERIERERQGQLDSLEMRLKEEINTREEQQKNFEEELKLLAELYENELKRRQVEWREEYEREKEEMKDCTDSLQKVTAYRKLETKYSKWSWRLRSAMMETENKLHNKVDKVIREIEETDLQRELQKTSEEVEKSMSEFFEKDKDKDILIQWKTSFEIKIKELQENIVRESKKKFNEVLQQRDLKKKIDVQRTYNENTLYEKSKELALKLKDKTNNETLKKEFDFFWEQSVKKIIKDTQGIKDIDIMRDVKEILTEIYDGFLPINYLKMNRDIFSLSSYSYYVQDKKNIVFAGSGRDSFKSKEKLGYILSKEEEGQIKSLVTDVEQQTDRMIQSFYISKMGYNISHIQQLTDYIKRRVTEHQEGAVKYKFKKKFFIHLVLSICKQANKMITDQHRMFRDANDPEIYLKKKKNGYYSIFQKHLHGATSAAIFGAIICQKLKEPIEQSLYKKTARDITDEMMKNCVSLNGNRLNLEKHILKTLAEEENFDKYMNYIHNPRDHFRSFIRDEVSRYITDKFSVRILPKMKDNIEILQKKIMKAAQESTEHVQVNSGDAGLWLKRFTQKLSNDLIFSEKDLSGVKHEGVEDFKLLKDVIEKHFFNITFDISSRFNTETFPVNLDYKFRPDEILIDHFCQCCWVQCPFCGATCTNTIENHHEDHSVPFHRVTGINGTCYPSTQNLCADICTNLVASHQYFNTVDGMFKYRKYKKAGGRFANWSITSDLSDLPYWRWFVCRFRKNLEKHYSKTFDGSGKIPDDWRKCLKLDAIESVVDPCI